MSVEPLPHRPVTLADIAREAGTSASTASRALSGRGYVSDTVRERLLAVADRLGYVPNASAQTLKQRTSRVVGVVVSALDNQFYAGLAAGIEQVLREANYQMVILGDNSDPDEEIAGVRTFLAMRAPGVIMTPVGTEAASLLQSRGIAVVEIDRRLTPACDGVVIDNERGGREATMHLIGLGHRRIALLGVDTPWTTDAGRLKGYRTALKTARIPFDRRLVASIPVRSPDVEARIEALLDSASPTAIFAANNELAEQAWRVLRRRGLRIPADISLVGFDDVAWMEMVDPPITVVDQPTIELGRAAAGLLLRRLEKGPLVPPAVEMLQPRLVVRGSTGPAPKRSPRS
ncbi:MAG TPA: LacI family DNA-binding transcriptional regulator [Gaiellaceae bacterium]|jgi:DNA-binding LacI/PurR family transcriptional regulator|nr:LacI family DNA-binding transcriptional regulator [Gaiellaceae bacterium]